MREAFALQELLSFFSTINIGILEILTFEILTKRLLTASLVLNNQTLVSKKNSGPFLKMLLRLHLWRKCFQIVCSRSKLTPICTNDVLQSDIAA